jgi:hypothetical protein
MKSRWRQPCQPCSTHPSFRPNRPIRDTRTPLGDPVRDPGERDPTAKTPATAGSTFRTSEGLEGYVVVAYRDHAAPPPS